MWASIEEIQKALKEQKVDLINAEDLKCEGFPEIKDIDFGSTDSDGKTW